MKGVWKHSFVVGSRRHPRAFHRMYRDIVSSLKKIPLPVPIMWSFGVSMGPSIRIEASFLH